MGHQDEPVRGSQSNGRTESLIHSSLTCQSNEWKTVGVLWNGGQLCLLSVSVWRQSERLCKDANVGAGPFIVVVVVFLPLPHSFQNLSSLIREPTPSAVKVQRSNCWTAGEFPGAGL